MSEPLSPVIFYNLKNHVNKMLLRMIFQKGGISKQIYAGESVLIV